MLLYEFKERGGKPDERKRTLEAYLVLVPVAFNKRAHAAKSRGSGMPIWLGGGDGRFLILVSVFLFTFTSRIRFFFSMSFFFLMPPLDRKHEQNLEYREDMVLSYR